ncbi:MAG: hypothetical protein SOI38_03510 [Eggerthellaceae bacterium]|jgi:hypothetical protein
MPHVHGTRVEPALYTARGGGKSLIWDHSIIWDHSNVELIGSWLASVKEAMGK